MQYKVQGLSRGARFISEVGDWLRVRVWEHFCTFTFEEDVSTISAGRCFTRFMACHAKGVKYFYVVEPHNIRLCAHIHCVLGPLLCMSGKDIEAEWRWKYGIAEVKPYDKTKGGIYYLCKRITDPKIEWDFELI